MIFVKYQYFDFEGSVLDNNTISGLNSTFPGVMIGNNVQIVDSNDSVFGKVVSFGEGSGSYIKISDFLNTAKNSYTLSTWVKYDSSVADTNRNASAVVFQQDNQGRTLLNIKPNGQLNTYITAKNIDSKNAIQKDKWQHITVSFDVNNHVVNYYINGKFDSSNQIGTGTVDQITSLLIGSHKNFGSDPHQMRGFLDEISIFDRVLTNEEVYSNYSLKGKQVYMANTFQPLLDEAKELLSNEKVDKFSNNLLNLKQMIERIEGSYSTLSLDELESYFDELTGLVSTAKTQQPISLSIDTNQILRSIDAQHIFGINHRYAFNGYGSFDEQLGKVRTDFTELYKKAGFGSIRYPGGTISNLFNWKTAIGPIESRKKQIHGFYNNPGQGGIEANFGLSEIATFAQEVDSEMVYVYSLGRGNSQDASDLMEFLNARVGTNPNGGIDWAEVRSDLGHPEPFKIKFFEIGNEMNQGGANGDGTVSQSYWTAYVTGKNTEQAYTEGGRAKFTEQYVVDEDNWNQSSSYSDGKANIVKYMRYANSNPKKYVDKKIINDPDFVAVEKGSVKVFVGNGKDKVEWQIVPNFNNSTNSSKHVVIDYSTGAIKFGDGKKGMIPESGLPIRVSYEVQRDGFIQISENIKETMKNISDNENEEKNAFVFSSYESPQFIQHMATLNKNNLYDGLTIHPYSGHVNGGSNIELFYDDAMLKAERTGIQHVKDYVSMLPEGKVPVISEYGIFRNTEPQVRSLTHALYISKTLMEYVKLGSPYIQKHTLVDWYSSGGDSLGPTQQAVIQAVPQQGASTKTGKGEFKYFSTPSALVFEMLNKGFGNNVLDTQMEQVPKLENGVTAISNLVSQDDEGNIYVALSNVDRTQEYDLSFDFVGTAFNGKIVEVQKLTSKKISDENTLENPNNVKIESSNYIYEKNMTYTITPHTFVILKFNVK